MARSHALPAARLAADERLGIRRPLTFAPPRDMPLARDGAAPAGAPKTPPADSRRKVERGVIFILVAAAHLGAVLGFARVHARPVVPPQPPITVTLIEPPVAVATPMPPAAPPAPLQPEARSAPRPPVVRPAPPKRMDAPRPRAPASEPENPVRPAPPAMPAAIPPEVAVAVADVPAPAPPAAPVTATPHSRAEVPTAPEPVAARYDAAYLNNPAPDYPLLARRMHEEGKVLLRVFVTAEGTPGKIQLSASSGSSRLDAAAESAVFRWRFVPAKQDGRDVDAWVVVPIVFKLEGL
jgi:protein TonB